MADTYAFCSGAGTTDSSRALRLFYSLRSRLKYAGKHFSADGRALTWGVTLFLEPLARVAMGLIFGRWTVVRETLNGYWMLVTWIAGLREGE